MRPTQPEALQLISSPAPALGAFFAPWLPVGQQQHQRPQCQPYPYKYQRSSGETHETHLRQHEWPMNGVPVMNGP